MTKTLILTFATIAILFSTYYVFTYNTPSKLTSIVVPFT